MGRTSDIQLVFHSSSALNKISITVDVGEKTCMQLSAIMSRHLIGDRHDLVRH